MLKCYHFTSFLASKFDLVTVPLLGLKYSNYSTGADIIAALENGLSDWPNGEGKFLQVSGIEYGFRPDQPSGSRVDPELVKIQGEYIKLDEVRGTLLIMTTTDQGGGVKSPHFIHRPTRHILMNI